MRMKTILDYITLNLEHPTLLNCFQQFSAQHVPLAIKTERWPEHKTLFLMWPPISGLFKLMYHHQATYYAKITVT